ncbi:isoleucine--tRNA ligase, partial [Candidatus Woesearchaeota archaeon]|nr:isoleucine--tRNA ligase [Candidatus Woesearchaeota archaeon]
MLIGKYDYKEVEKEIRLHWRKIELLKKIQEQNVNGDSYFLLDGPPYANNIPHVGHIRNTVYKDFYIRLAMMQGKNVLFQPGFDTHGLPIENVVEKKLGLKSKKEINQLGIKKFCDTCKENATNYKEDWLKTYEKLGSWYSWKEPYLTYDNNYIESVWWSFKKMWDKGMVYEGKKPVFWCPKCETALAGYETTDSYAEKEDPLIIVKFKVKNTENDHLLVFTTTPWTLPANVAIIVKGDADYVKTKTNQGNLIIAKNLLTLLQDLKINYEIIEEFKGEKIDGLEYEPILDVPTQQELTKNPKTQRVYMSIQLLKERVNAKVAAKLGIKSGDIHEDFVSVDDGTGLVHCAPGHGKTDNLVGIKYGLPNISPLDDQCRFTDDAGKYEGLFVKDADKTIIEDLKKQGKMLYAHKITHSYPLCWRCKSPLIFRLSNQWFLKTDTIKKQMLKANEDVVWQPEFAGERFQTWVENAEDWNFSRQRFWGIPIPIWKSEQGELKVIGSIEELEKELGEKLPKDFDLHTIGEIKFKSKTGNEMTTIGDIFDVWFDSGSAPYAAFHYPFENKEKFESHYPVDRINESQDQVRGWFYSLMFCGMGAIEKEPYKTISMPAWVVDKDGEKMSKSLGNFIGAEEAMDGYGADNVTLYYCSDVDPASTARFNPDTVLKDTT